MSIIKLEIRISELAKAIDAFRHNRKSALEALSTEVRRALSGTMNELMRAEIGMFLGQSDQVDNKRNGYQPEREYILKGIGGITIRSPKDRKGRFESQVVPTSERIDPRLKADMAVLHLAGLSTRTLSMISNRLLGIEVSRETISSSLDLIAGEAERWLTRPLSKPYWALYIDGTNFKVQRRGSTEREPSLVVLGVDENNFRSILAIEPGSKDDVDSWRGVFSELKKRGLQAKNVRLGIMDGLPGLEKLFKEEFPQALTQRCWVHSMRNAMAKTPARLRDAFKIMAHKVMYATSENAARNAFGDLQTAMGSDATRAVKCLAKDLDSLLVHYRFDRKCWVALRTTNAIEAINRQFKRRTKTMDTIGEQTLEAVLAFTALRIEFNWQKSRIDSGLYNRKKRGDGDININVIEATVAEMNLLN
jgi:putative transposase